VQSRSESYKSYNIQMFRYGIPAYTSPFQALFGAGNINKHFSDSSLFSSDDVFILILFSIVVIILSEFRAKRSMKYGLL
jgi:hypothetical protein